MSITDGTDLIDPRSYEVQGTPHRTFTELRRRDPLPFCEPKGFENFWAVTRHADICEISKQPNLFLNSKGIVVLDDNQQISRDEGIGAMRTIIEMDPPEHVTYRKVTSAWFTPRALGRLDDLIENSARHLVDSLAGPGGDGECDYAIDVAAAHPLRILCSVLGVPREEEGRVLRLTNQLFAADDPELQRSAEDRNAAMRELGFELFEFFSKVIEDRRANPRDDLASIIANAKIGGEPMGPMETFGYCLIIFTAGHDTTKNALVGAMEAFLNNPEQLDRLRSGGDEVIDSAVEESVRWVTPVNYMKRTAARETTLRGRTIAEGDQLVLFYASANRDEEVFEDPFDFRIDRTPNPHLGFGIGEHFCLGAHLARRSQAALLRQLATRLESVERIGDPEQIRSSFVVGLKHLPVRYRFTPAA
jgi:cytochrome P450